VEHDGRNQNNSNTYRLLLSHVKHTMTVESLTAVHFIICQP